MQERTFTKTPWRCHVLIVLIFVTQLQFHIVSRIVIITVKDLQRHCAIVMFSLSQESSLSGKLIDEDFEDV